MLLFLVDFIHPLYTFFFFNDTATTEIYTLSLHDALPILLFGLLAANLVVVGAKLAVGVDDHQVDRKSTRLNSSHVRISYAVFCLKKKNEKEEKKRLATIRVHNTIEPHVDLSAAWVDGTGA